MLDSSDDTARLFYLVLLGCWILAGVFFSYRNQLPKALRDASIWVLIFVLTITAYGLKDIFWAQLNPGTAVMIDDRSVALARDASGHFVAELEVNGVAISFLVDTGASEIVLSQRDAARIGIAIEDLNFSGRAFTANGTVRTANVVLDEITLGSFTDRNVRARVNGGELFGSLLGISYLDRFKSWQVVGDQMVLSR
ncbi:MAG: TIGR02281 family clan AA aspartic protease [Pseudomonadota bacterium]